MNSELKSIIIKLLITAGTAWATKQGVSIDGDTMQAIVAGAVALGAVVVSVIDNRGMKKVPVSSTAVDIPPHALPAPGNVVSITAKVVGALLLGFLICGVPQVSHAQPVNLCDPTVIFKGPLNFTTFIAKLKACGADDIAAAIADAQKQVPPDNGALGCLLPVQTIIGGQSQGGLILQFQLFRDAKKAGLLSNCVNYVNSTLLLP